MSESGLDDLLSRHMLRRQRQAADVGTGLFPFSLGVGRIIVEFGAEISANFLGFLRILHRMDAAKDDDAFDIQRLSPSRRKPWSYTQKDALSQRRMASILCPLLAPWK